jgi:hypothetical protein
MITNQDVQEILNSNERLFQEIEKLNGVNPGSGETNIHWYAYKRLLEELAWHRSFNN